MTVPGSGSPSSACFARLLTWGSRAAVLFSPFSPVPLSFGRDAVLCCHLPPTGGERERAWAKSLPPKCLLGVEGRPEPRRLRGTDGAAPAWLPPSAFISQRSASHSPAARAPFPALRNFAAGVCSSPSALLATGSGSACWRHPGGLRVVAAAAAERAMEHVTEGSWESLPVPLHSRVLGALRELGFPYMTPVQVPSAGRGEKGPPCAGGR